MPGSFYPQSALKAGGVFPQPSRCWAGFIFPPASWYGGFAKQIDMGFAENKPAPPKTDDLYLISFSGVPNVPFLKSWNCYCYFENIPPFYRSTHVSHKLWSCHKSSHKSSPESLQKDLKCSYGYLAVTAVHHWKSMDIGLKTAVNSGQLPEIWPHFSNLKILKSWK